jgi:hypothetical protein
MKGTVWADISLHTTILHLGMDIAVGQLQTLYATWDEQVFKARAGYIVDYFSAVF